ncbi:MAG: GIY-YIG nuclease family protein [Bacteroidota bacterium]
MFTVYVLFSEIYRKIYIGQTSDLSTRLQYHNELSDDGWTKKYLPWVLLYSESCASRTEALKREKQLKTSRGRAFVWSLIKE